jgi:cytochrome c peroxidase
MRSNRAGGRTDPPVPATVAAQRILRTGRYRLRFTRAVCGCALLVVLMAAVCAAGPLAPLDSPPVPESNPQTPEKVELGKKLFFDRRLSGDGTMNCAACHDPELAFTDQLAISLSYPTTKNWRNAPTLLNVGLQKQLFHDGRALSLEEQALFPMMSAFEMNRNIDFLEEEIRSVPQYVTEFNEVFGDPDITRQRIAMAIAAFERTLVSRNAPIDTYLKGNKQALSPDVLAGYAVFMGKGKCSDCHHGAVLSDHAFHALNVPEHPEHRTDPRIAATRRFVAKVYHYPEYRTLSEDPGRYLITKDKKDWKAFKTPTLREIAKTGPYMHNGIFQTLDEVIEFFDKGGGNGNAALKALNLSADEKKGLKAFLEKALSGEQTPFRYPVIP